MHRVTDKQYIIASTIIGNLDEPGYLLREIPALCDDLAFNHGIEANEQEVEEVLRIIQGFDPPGIGARNLQERPKQACSSFETGVGLRRYYGEGSVLM